MVKAVRGVLAPTSLPGPPTVIIINKPFAWTDNCFLAMYSYIQKKSIKPQDSFLFVSFFKRLVHY